MSLQLKGTRQLRAADTAVPHIIGDWRSLQQHVSNLYMLERLCRIMHAARTVLGKGVVMCCFFGDSRFRATGNIGRNRFVALIIDQPGCVHRWL